jgi:hypothetical protein
MHVIINLVDKYTGLSLLGKSRRGRENIKEALEIHEAILDIILHLKFSIEPYNVLKLGDF